MSTIISFYSEENDQTLIKCVETEDNLKLYVVRTFLVNNGYSAITFHKTLSLEPLSTFPVLGI